MTCAGTVRIGISGWTYAPWRGVFYPEGLAHKRELEFASRALTKPGRFRLVPAPANGQPGLATYLRGPGGAFHAEALQVLTLSGGRVARITAFRDPGLFAGFGLPATTGG